MKPTILKILFICKYEYDGIPHFAIVDDPVQFLSSFIDSVSVCTVYYKYQALCTSVVVPPQWADFILSSNILYARKILDLVNIRTY